MENDDREVTATVGHSTFQALLLASIAAREHRRTIPQEQGLGELPTRGYHFVLKDEPGN